MRLVPESITVAEGDGFKNDLFGRRLFGERLTNLILAIGQSPTTLLLDGPWGAGKTTFVQMWCDTLRSKGVPIIYFNAFDNDYLNDAFTALAGEFVVVETADSDRRQKLLDAAKKVGKSLAIHGSRYAVKAATLGVIDLADLKGIAEDVAKDMASDASDAAASIIEDRLTARENERSAMVEFRNKLAEFVATVATAHKSDTVAERPPLAFVIDELDRCKPDFALSLVEGAKHLFTVPGVVFVLVTNLSQLCSAVQATYGAGIDARTYLEKFYHLKILLPKPDPEPGPSNVAKFLDRIFADLPSDVTRPSQRGAIHQEMAQHLLILHSKMGLSLRKLERLATQIAVVYASTRASQLRLAPLIADLCLMKSDAPTLYATARNGSLTWPSLANFLPYPQWHNKQDESAPAVLWSINLWRYLLGEEMIGEGPSKEQFEREFARYGMSKPRRLIEMTCSWIDGFAFEMPASS